MNKTVEETRRELFEQKYPPNEGIEWNPHNSKYETFSFFDRSRQHSCDWQNDMFEVFNAALDAVEIELPEKRCIQDANDMYGVARNGTINECRLSVESLNLGLKIK